MDDIQSGDPVLSDESPAQKQARLRRERREAKIKAGGSSRLDKISQLSGKPAEGGTHAFYKLAKPRLPTHASKCHILADLVPPIKVPPPSPAQDPALSSVADPNEGDISNHQYPTRTISRNGAPTEADIRQLLRSAPPTQDTQNGSGQQQGESQDDPMIRMLQQIMGGMPGAQESDQGGIPPGLDALLGSGGGKFPGMPGQELDSGSTDRSAYLWKIVHAVFAFILGIYMTAVTTFNGAQFSRVPAVTKGTEGEVGTRLFWIFATTEVVLQGSRFALERGKTSQSGSMGMLMQFLPEPWRSYVGLVAQYSGIWTTIVEDAMVVVFVLGCVAWWRGAVT
ncbi:MAG: hypothetical protein Q9184_004007 [Pyrenodesmia sp. 2 TL-2023]